MDKRSSFTPSTSYNSSNRRRTVKKRTSNLGSESSLEVSSSASKTSVTSTKPFDYIAPNGNKLAGIFPMRAALDMMIVLQQQHREKTMLNEPPFINPPDQSLDDPKLTELEQKIYEVEQESKQFSRRLKECRINQVRLRERIEELKMSMYKSQQIAVVKHLMGIVPTENDLEVLKKMKAFEVRRSEIHSELKNEELHCKVLERTLEHAEAIIMESLIIKKRKKVVFFENKSVAVDDNLLNAETPGIEEEIAKREEIEELHPEKDEEHYVLQSETEGQDEVQSETKGQDELQSETKGKDELQSETKEPDELQSETGGQDELQSETKEQDELQTRNEGTK